MRLVPSGIARAVLAVAAGTVLTSGAALPRPALATTAIAPALIDLSGSTDFQQRFNEDRSHVRLVLLLSPT